MDMPLDVGIQEGAGTNYARIGNFIGMGDLPIMEVKSSLGFHAWWGRLKSGAGWISIDC